MLKEKTKVKHNGYFADFHRQIPLPNFEFEDHYEPISFQILNRLFEIVLEFSYDYQIVYHALTII